MRTISTGLIALLLSMLICCYDSKSMHEEKQPDLDYRYVLNMITPVRLAYYLAFCAQSAERVGFFWGSDNDVKNKRKCIDRMIVEVGGKRAIILPSAYLDLTNIKTVYFFTSNSGINFVLMGGDTGTSYVATYQINKHGSLYYIYRREVHSLEMPDNQETANYWPLVLGNTSKIKSSVAEPGCKKIDIEKDGVKVEYNCSSGNNVSGSRILENHLTIDGMECYTTYSSVADLNGIRSVKINRNENDIAIEIDGYIWGSEVNNKLLYHKEKKRCVISKAIVRHHKNTIKTAVYGHIREKDLEKL